MRKLLMLVALVATQAFAEASFDQIESLIQQKNYAAAEAGLEVIVKNHPNSAKAFYAMAQAQAGLGNLEKAQKALNIATGLNPTLDFAPEGSVQKLKQAITPQTAKIEAVEESHVLRNFALFLLIVAGGYFIYTVYARKQEEEQAERDAEFLREEAKRQEREAQRKREHMEMLAKQDAERKAELKAEEELKSHKNYGHERFDPENPDKLKTVKRMKEEAAEKQRLFVEAQERREAQARADAAEANARMYRTSAQAVQPTHTTVVNNSNDGLLTGILIGDMMNHHHDTPRVVEREVIREVPASRSSRDSSWDDTPSTPSRSSSWDDTPSTSSSRSSSWDSDSSSSSSSSWSSSSSSDSSSSWSSSSSDSGSSSSSWD